MTGAWICTPKLKDGPAVKYKARLFTHKKIFFTPGFIVAQGAVVNIIKRIAGLKFDGSLSDVLLKMILRQRLHLRNTRSTTERRH